MIALYCGDQAMYYLEDREREDGNDTPRHLSRLDIAISRLFKEMGHIQADTTMAPSD